MSVSKSAPRSLLERISGGLVRCLVRQRGLVRHRINVAPRSLLERISGVCTRSQTESFSQTERYRQAERFS